MHKVEKHIIKKHNPLFKEIDNLSFLSKNLYNKCLYEYKENLKNNIYHNESTLHHLLKTDKNYIALPRKVSSSVIIQLIKNWKSYYKACQSYKSKSELFKSYPKQPQFKHKIKGRNIVSYTNQAISKKVYNKSNKIKLSLSNIEFKTKIVDFKSIDQVRIIPKYGYYVIEVVYTLPDITKLNDNNNYLSIDLGVNNLCAITSNITNPLIINGKPLKSINQYYNKKKSIYQSKLPHYKEKLGKKLQNKTSKRIENLSLKRKNKIDNYLHKASKLIINTAINNKINTIIIGKNKEQKQDINIGKVNNQNFVNIPLSRFIEMISYKCEEKGLNLILQEESYTSKASFLSLDKIPIYNKGNNETKVFSGYRKYRGLYHDNKINKNINSDINGSYNILRKAIPNVFNNGIEGIRVHPNIISIVK